MSRVVNVRELTDEAPIRRFHLQVLLICFFTAVVDGLDTQVIGFTAPAISKDLGIPLSAFGLVFSAGVFGTLLGAVLLGRLADRIGRRSSLILCTLSFGVLTIVTPWVHDITALAVLRFAGGLGLGGAMPIFLTLASEYAPKSRRALATGLLWCGYPMGGVVGGLLGAALIERQGWESMFLAGGFAAFGVALLQWLLVPESPQFLALKGGMDEKIRGIASRLRPSTDFADATFVADLNVETKAKAGVWEVFADGRATATVLLWGPLFLTFMMTKIMVAWAPGLLATSGMTLSTAALMAALGNFASVPSMAAAGYLLDRMGPMRLLPITYGCLALSFVALGFSLGSTPVVAAAMVAVGFLSGPGIAGLLFLSTSLYPSHVRSTGAGLAMGFGRSGQVFGAGLIGMLLGHGMAPREVFSGMALIPVIALLCVLLLARALRPQAAPHAA